jgi:hypothetical protein
MEKKHIVIIGVSVIKNQAEKIHRALSSGMSVFVDERPHYDAEDDIRGQGKMMTLVWVKKGSEAGKIIASGLDWPLWHNQAGVPVEVFISTNDEYETIEQLQAAFESAGAEEVRVQEIA